MKLKTTLILLLFVQFAFGQNRIQKIDSSLDSLYSIWNINGNVLIAEKGEIIYQHSFGNSNEMTKEKLNENSVFEMASITKQFTSMAIMILKEKGKLKLDESIAKYIPELAAYKNVTVRNLLNHTGGLPDYMELMDSLYDKSKIATNKDMITIFTKYQPKVLFEPNSKWEYSNTGYALLASIIERVSGLTYADYLDKNIFKPLKMNNTFVYSRRLAPKNIENYAFGYVYSDSLKKYILPDELKEYKIVIWMDGIVGDGNVNTTAKDLLIWDRALYTDKLISKEGMKEVFEITTLIDGSKINYGFGWEVSENSEFGKLILHGGTWHGYKTYIERDVSNDKTIIILQNHTPASESEPVKQTRNIIYNKPLPIQKVRKEVAVTTEQIQKLVGTYEIQKGKEVKMSIKNGQLFTQMTGQPPYQLFAESELLFFLKVVDAQVQFEKDDNGEINHLFLLQGGNKTEAIRKK